MKAQLEKNVYIFKLPVLSNYKKSWNIKVDRFFLFSHNLDHLFTRFYHPTLLDLVSTQVINN